MQNGLLLVLLLVLVGAPGLAAMLLVFCPGRLSVTTALAATFGLGYAVAAGSAFVLTACDVMTAAAFVTVWSVVSVGLWVGVALRRGVGEHARAFACEASSCRWALLLGGGVLVAVAVAYAPYLRMLDTQEFVYFLNGMQIANSHGMPQWTLQYGTAWPPATDKVLGDCFSAAITVLYPNHAVGPTALTYMSAFGAGVGLWAAAREFGLERTGGLVPLVLILNTRFPEAGMTGKFMLYREENLGRAVAFCALAVAVGAIRRRDRRQGIIAGVLLGAASGTHLIAAVAVCILIGLYLAIHLVSDRDWALRRLQVARMWPMVAVAGISGLAIRFFAGGDFGLRGARDPALYRQVSDVYDVTGYIAALVKIPWSELDAQRWFVPPSLVFDTFTAKATGLHWNGIEQLLLLAAALAISIIMLVRTSGPLRILPATGVAFFAAVTVMALYFSFRYGFYTEGTFAYRRMADYVPIAIVLLGFGAIEAALIVLRRRGPAVTRALVGLLAIGLGAWLLPGMAPQAAAVQGNQERIGLFTWIRTHTPCNARFLVNSRTEGAFEGLTGRYSLTEGMGPYLRPRRLPEVIHVLDATSTFFRHPRANRQTLTNNHITYVIAVHHEPLHLGALYLPAADKALDATPFLQPVYRNPDATIYRVHNATPTPISPLLTGKYRHCRTKPITM